MYKVKQLAEMLNVETVHIHEKLIELRDVLHSHIIKKNSITYVDYEGFQILKQGFKDLNNSIKPLVNLDANDSISVNVSNLNQSEASHEVSNNNKQIESIETFQSDVELIKQKISEVKQDINKLDIQLHREMEALQHYIRLSAEI